MISPAPAITSSKFNQLLKNNFSLIFGNEFTSGRFQNVISVQPGMAQDVHIMQILFKTGKLRENSAEIFETLALNVPNWPFVLKSRHHAEEHMSKAGIKNKYCHIGEELLFNRNVLFIVTPPNNKKLARSTASSIESGLYSLLFSEAIGIAASRRVQGRRRLLSPTKFLEDPRPLKPLKLQEGKVFFIETAFNCQSRRSHGLSAEA